MPPAASDTSPVMSERHAPTAFQRREPGFRPGERMLDGKLYVFNADLLNGYLAEEAIATAPADLAVLNSTELKLLDYRCIRRLADTHLVDPPALALHARVTEERTRRGLNTAFTTAKAGERAA